MSREMMRSVRLTGRREMQMATTPRPALRAPTDVLLRMERVGVCGSDVHYYTTGRIGSQVVDYPFTVGHEGSAVVEAVGGAVSRVRPGDRVAIEPAVCCHHCDQCLAGREHTCRALDFLGCPGQIEGCLSEYLVMPEPCCFPIPATMSLDDAALAEPLSIGLYAVQQSIPMAGANVGILGAGPIGLSVLLPALAQGARAVYVTDRLDYRGNAARANGAAWTGNPDREDVVKTICDQEPMLLDVVFECCGQQSALDQGLEMLKPGGKLMLIGIPEFDRFSFAADIGRRRELCIQHVRRQNNCVQPAIDAIANGAIRPQFMVTHHFPLTETQQAFDLVDNYGDGVIKAMIRFDP